MIRIFVSFINLKTRFFFVFFFFYLQEMPKLRSERRKESWRWGRGWEKWLGMGGLHLLLFYCAVWECVDGSVVCASDLLNYVYIAAFLSFSFFFVCGCAND